MRKPAKKPAEVAMPVSAPANWHKRLAGVTGELSLAVVRRSMTKGQLMAWSVILKEVAGEIDALTNRPR